MSSTEIPASSTSRRTLLKGAAWAVPAVVAVGATPAFAVTGLSGRLSSVVYSCNNEKMTFEFTDDVATSLEMYAPNWCASAPLVGEDSDSGGEDKFEFKPECDTSDCDSNEQHYMRELQPPSSSATSQAQADGLLNDQLAADGTYIIVSYLDGTSETIYLGTGRDKLASTKKFGNCGKYGEVCD